MGRLVERCASQLIAASADAALYVGLAGLIPPRCQAEMSANVARLSEPAWLVDGGAECQRGQRSNARDRHQPSASGFDTHLVDYSLGELVSLLGHDLDDRQQRLRQGRQHRVIGGQFANPCRKIFAARRADLQSYLASSALMPFSTSRRLLSTIRLAVSSARQERQDGLFT